MLTRSTQHQEDNMAEKRQASGATEHSKGYHGGLIGTKLAKLSNMHERKLRESLQINNIEAKAEYDKSIKVLNSDQINIVNTNSWKPWFRKINMALHANVMQ